MSSKMFLSKYEAEVYAIFRIVAGFLFLWHGSQKLFGFPAAAFAVPHNAMVIIGGLLELIGGVLVMAGFLTRWTAFICSGEMAFAYWAMHGTHALLPIVNNGELAMLYCFLFLFISSKGAGSYSFDKLIEKKGD